MSEPYPEPGVRNRRSPSVARDRLGCPRAQGLL